MRTRTVLVVCAALALAAVAGAQGGRLYTPRDLPRIVDPKPVFPPRSFTQVDSWLYPVPKHDPAFTLSEWLGEDPLPAQKAVAAELRKDGFQIGRHKVWDGLWYAHPSAVNDVIYAFLFRNADGAHAAFLTLEAAEKTGFNYAQRRNLSASGLGEESYNEWEKRPDEDVVRLWRRKNLVILNIAHCESHCDFPGITTLGLRTDSFSKDRDDSWQVFLGTQQPNPVLSGGGTFTIDPTGPTGIRLLGAISGGEFTGGPGVIPLRLGLIPGSPPAELHLLGARLQATCSAAGCTGRLGGGITQAEIDSVIVPAMAAAMQMRIDEEPSCTPSTPEGCTGQIAVLLQLFDKNDDFTITADELRANFFFESLLTPDLDLLDAHGNPGPDGVYDCLSIGLAFTAKSATFQLTGGSSEGGRSAALTTSPAL